ncbi:MAG TPA: hypothetical protein VF428_00015 [Casimicrobiaceae bacterium]
MDSLSITLEQLRATANAGGIRGATLRARGGEFVVEVDTANGRSAVLARARSSEPRHFGNPASAIGVLHKLGIVVMKIDATEWDPTHGAVTRRRTTRAEAMREAHRAAAYNRWLAGEVQASIDDPRPSISHEEVAKRIAIHVKRLKRGRTAR